MISVRLANGNYYKPFLADVSNTNISVTGRPKVNCTNSQESNVMVNSDTKSHSMIP